jgi:hypothetical protein
LVQAAKLIFHIDAGLATQIQQILAFNVQLASQLIDANLLRLQAALLCG